MFSGFLGGDFEFGHLRSSAALPDNVNVPTFDPKLVLGEPKICHYVASA